MQSHWVAEYRSPLQNAAEYRSRKSDLCWWRSSTFVGVWETLKSHFWSEGQKQLRIEGNSSSREHVRLQRGPTLCASRGSCCYSSAKKIETMSQMQGGKTEASVVSDGALVEYFCGGRWQSNIQSAMWPQTALIHASLMQLNLSIYFLF